jgi:hypothetical protein
MFPPEPRVPAFGSLGLVFFAIPYRHAIPVNKHTGNCGAAAFRASSAGPQSMQ